MNKTANTQHVIDRLLDIFRKYHRGIADLTIAGNLVRRSMTLCSDEQQLEIVAWMHDLIVHEQLPASNLQVEDRPVPLHPLVIRMWATFGDTGELSRFIFSDYSESSQEVLNADFNSRWARWKCAEMVYALSSAPERFHKSTLEFIRDQCSRLNNRFIGNTTAGDAFIAEIARLENCAEHAELRHLQDFLLKSETQSVSERRAAIVKTHMKTALDFGKEAKLNAMAKDLDEQGIPLPPKKGKKGKRDSPRDGTYSDVFIHNKKPQIWKRHILDVLKRNLYGRTKEPL